VYRGLLFALGRNGPVNWCNRPLLEHAGALPDCQPDPRPVLDHAIKDAFGLIEAAAGEHHLDHALVVLCPLLDLVEVAMFPRPATLRFLRRTSRSLQASRFIRQMRVLARRTPL